MRRKGSSKNYKKSKSHRRDSTQRYYTKDDIFVSRMASILLMPKSKVVNIFNQKKITTLRINTLKTKPKEVLNSLKRRGYELEQVPWALNTYFVTNKNKSEISQIEEYQKGFFYIQDLSSILATLILEPNQNDRVLDICAAPGSKTTHIAEITDNKATIFANDSEVARTNALRNVIEQFGATSVKITLSDGRDFGKRYPDYFNKVLLDAPCSGEGRITLRGSRPLRYWSIKKVKRLTTLQKELIESSFITLKTGGTLVYTTCTLEPEENEGVVTHLLNKHKNAKLQKIDIVESKEFGDYRKHITQGIKNWSGNTYHKEITKSIRIIPSPEMMGFYIAKIIKK
ncbi:RsmB/NOP family class I SAM-dependent RNA methyltransferase [Candidatus Dojkabacteria bacterium]|uniref:RsmB/NOP family class I SAM-dependent RNA methyltransferase n=1 Tax=Candidatus Dojkabacteria bacterium TaxID=2099670 RepID=A0A847VCF5_9BACT|nr:RsmB/NOP family class I SAM-dependent RNA methyltransferase [Candidatus Dojkabacteria bacterium]